MVEEEPLHTTMQGVRMPEIMTTMDNSGVLIWVQVAGEQSNLQLARRAKIRKYFDDPTIKQEVSRTTGATSIMRLPVILS